MTLVHRTDRDATAVLTLDSPANRNALSRGLVSELQAHLDDAETDRAVRALALTATGTTFCAGADLKDPPVQHGPGSIVDVLRTLWDYPKPVVVAVNGHVRAGGLGLVAAADVVLAVRRATFAFTEVRLGLAPAMISVLCLRKMQPAAASRYLLTGSTFDAEAAVAAGLVTTVVDDGPLDPAPDLALDPAFGSPLESALGSVIGEFRLCEPHALQVTRALIRRLPQLDPSAGFAEAQEISARLFASPQAAEGIAAFRERRPPSWVTEARTGKPD